VRAVVWECREGQTDTQTRVTDMHFASATLHAKCNQKVRLQHLTEPSRAWLLGVYAVTLDPHFPYME